MGIGSGTKIRGGDLLTDIQKDWASKRKQNISPHVLTKLVMRQNGRCKLSGAKMIFDKGEGTPQEGRGCHPLCAAVDHISPGNPAVGVQLVCYALNDLKGHLPLDCFQALAKTKEWRKLMRRWRDQALKDPDNHRAFVNLIRPRHPIGKK